MISFIIINRRYLYKIDH